MNVGELIRQYSLLDAHRRVSCDKVAVGDDKELLADDGYDHA